MVVDMATRAADDFIAIRNAMRTPWMPKRTGTSTNHCDHCPRELGEKCLELCSVVWERQQQPKSEGEW